MPSRTQEQAFAEIKRLVRFGRHNPNRVRRVRLLDNQLHSAIKQQDWKLVEKLAEKDRDVVDTNEPPPKTFGEAMKAAQIRYRAACTVLEWAEKMAGDVDPKLEKFMSMSREEQDAAMDAAVADGSLTRQQANEILAEIRTEGYGIEGDEEATGSGEDSGPEEAGDDDQGATG